MDARLVNPGVTGPARLNACPLGHAFSYDGIEEPDSSGPETLRDLGLGADRPPDRPFFRKAALTEAGGQSGDRGRIKDRRPRA
jgi:hypothetical protein